MAFGSQMNHRIGSVPSKRCIHDAAVADVGLNEGVAGPFAEVFE